MINITEVLRFLGVNSPPLSLPDQGNLYYDSSAHKWKASSNTGSYVNLLLEGDVTAGISGTIATNQIAVGSGLNTINGSSALTFDGTSFGIGSNTIPGSESLYVHNTSASAYSVTVDNTSSSNGGFIRARNNSSNAIQVGVYGSASPGTILGINTAGISAIISNGPSALAIGTFDSHPFVLSTNNTEAARFDSSQNLLIGATSNGTSRSTKLFVSSSSSSDYSFVGKNSSATNGAFIDLFADTDESYLGVTGSTGFTAFGATRAKVFLFYGRSTNGIAFGTSVSAPIVFATNDTERMRLNESGNHEHTIKTVSYAASTALDLTANNYQTVSLTGDITFTTSNRGSGRSISIRIVGDGSTRNLTFPVGWTFLGSAAPATLAASKTAVLSIFCYGSNDSDIVAAYAVQP